jgi:hypothetical protein
MIGQICNQVVTNGEFVNKSFEIILDNKVSYY